MGKIIEGTPFHALLAGGGTGGHVFPALRLADELRRRGCRVSYTGSSKGLEARLTAEREIPFHPIPARPLVGQGVFGKLRSVATLGRSAWTARGLVRKVGADVVVGTGGYISAPAVVGGRLAGRPVLLLEPNARSGMANRWLSRWASEAAVAYESTTRELSCAAVVTGAPVREEFFRAAPFERPEDDVRLLVLGGSQGALQLNQTLPRAIVAASRALGGITVLHQCGPRHIEVTRQAYREARCEASSAEVEVVPFLEDMATAMARSHLIVSRAGALTLAEICAVGRASLLIPLAAALGHQRDNALELESAGAAEILEGEAVTSEALSRRLVALLGDVDRLESMAVAARGLAHEEAASHIVDRLAALVERRGRKRGGAA